MAALRTCEIRLRAERKAGQLLSKMEKNKGAAAPARSRGATTLKELGVSKDQSSRWQALAGVPEEEFEAALGGEEKPTTNGIIAKPPPHVLARCTDLLPTLSACAASVCDIASI